MCVFVFVSVWSDREGNVGLLYSMAPLPWPINFNQAARQALPFLPRPFCIRPPVPTRVLYYTALPGQCLETSPEEATERERELEGFGFTKEKKDPVSIKILPLSLSWSNHWAANALLGKVMGLRNGDSSAHLSNCIRGKLTMILTVLLVALSVSILYSSRSFSSCCFCCNYPSLERKTPVPLKLLPTS